ncbi:MAG: ferrous iron transport protein A [Eubacteriales bacterium]
MDELIGLCELEKGKSGRVVSIGLCEDMRRRVMCLGLSPGTEVTCYAYAPAGDPGAFRIRGTTIALRRSDAEKIRILPL